MAVKTLDDLFMHTLQDIYYAENQIIKALPKMSGKATSPELKAAFDSHLEETREHVKRLESVFAALGKKASAVKCDAIEGILDEAKELMEEIEDPETLDAAMLAGAQAVEHYEMTRYGTLASWAQTLGHDEVVKTLEQTLAEEKAADLKLTKIGEGRLNRKAV